MTAESFDLVAHRTKCRHDADIAYLSQCVAAPAYMSLPFLTMKASDDPEVFGYGQ